MIGEKWHENDIEEEIRKIKEIERQMEILNQEKNKILSQWFERFCEKKNMNKCEPAYCVFAKKCIYLNLLHKLKTE